MILIRVAQPSSELTRPRQISSVPKVPPLETSSLLCSYSPSTVLGFNVTVNVMPVVEIKGPKKVFDCDKKLCEVCICISYLYVSSYIPLRENRLYVWYVSIYQFIPTVLAQSSLVPKDVV